MTLYMDAVNLSSSPRLQACTRHEGGEIFLLARYPQHRQQDKPLAWSGIAIKESCEGRQACIVLKGLRIRQAASAVMSACKGRHGSLDCSNEVQLTDCTLLCPRTAGTEQRACGRAPVHLGGCADSSMTWRCQRRPLHSLQLPEGKGGRVGRLLTCMHPQQLGTIEA